MSGRGAGSPHVRPQLTHPLTQALLWLVRLAPLSAAVFCTLVDSVWARPGGGQSYTGRSGSGGSGGGGGGGGGELVFLLIRLIFIYPQVGVPVAIIALVVVWRVRKRGHEFGLDSWDSSALHHAAPARGAPAPQSLRALLALDPDFSRVIFEDFAYRLYAAAHRARADERALAALSPYLAANVRESLAAETPEGMSATRVIVGAMRITKLQLPDAADTTQAQVTLTLAYESNVSVGEPPHERTFYLRESWLLSRDKGARTKPPEQTERLGCPNCGAPFESTDSGRCKYCDQVVGNGRFAWLVTRRAVLSRELRPPALTSDTAEVGTHRPSLVAPDERAAWQALHARDPALTEQGLQARLQLIYNALNQAYSQGDLVPARGLLSDGMFDYLRYWTDAYRAEGLRNVLEQMHITRLQRVKVVSDRYFDAITFRVWATGLDYTVDERTGQRVSGSANRMRDYSEYWTLIRAAATHGQAHDAATCPNCAAPLNVTMAGNCSYCSAHVTRGEFDWVLSKIEQDEAYEG